MTARDKGPGDKLGKLPDAPGVYQFFDVSGRILYIGKAVSLKKRVRSYFSGRPDRAKTALLVSRIADLEVIVCDSEIEALLLENILIKKHRPPFNIDLKDDKHYPYVRLDIGDEFPRLEIVRRRRADGARYFGPFPAVTALRSTLKILNRHFRLRRCHARRFRNRVRPCLNHQMGLCAGPCCGLIGIAEYRQAVEAAAAILAGRGRPVLARLEKEMAQAAERLDFEAAAARRDAIADLKKVLAAQEIDAGRDEDLDVIAVAGSSEGDAVL
ncbi:MAG: excinuclease ABC subunit C, partial [Deltaproteobacteria bacterium]|nr:excinuclease ABC subunit C [Deltaproteobacteria bacterium]